VRRAFVLALTELRRKDRAVCRNIRTLFNFEPAVTDDEIRAASLQFVRKLSGFNKPSKANEAAFERAVDETAAVARRLLDSLTTTAAPRDRMVERERARQRNAVRFGKEGRAGHVHTHADGTTHSHPHDHDHPHDHSN
jgi:hypothetical protein